MGENEEEREVREKKKREVDKSRKEEEEEGAALMRKAAAMMFCNQRSAKLFLRLFLSEPKRGTRLELVLAEQNTRGREKNKKTTVRVLFNYG